MKAVPFVVSSKNWCTGTEYRISVVDGTPGSKNERLVRSCALDGGHDGPCSFGPWYDPNNTATVTVTRATSPRPTDE